MKQDPQVISCDHFTQQSYHFPSAFTSCVGGRGIFCFFVCFSPTGGWVKQVSEVISCDHFIQQSYHFPSGFTSCVGGRDNLFLFQLAHLLLCDFLLVSSACTH